MMEQKKEYITDALSEVKDCFIEEAISYKKVHRSLNKKEWAALGAFAAVLVLSVTTYIQLPMRETDNSTSATTGMEAATAERAEAAERTEAEYEGIAKETSGWEGIVEEIGREEISMEESTVGETVVQDSVVGEGSTQEAAKTEQNADGQGNIEENGTGGSMSGSTIGDGETLVESSNLIGVSAAASEVTPTGMTLVLSQEGGDVTGTLLTGEEYWLEQEVNGEWVSLKRRYDVIKEVAYVIKPNSTTEWQVDWKDLYGVLDAGIYRLGKKIDDYREAGDFDSYEIYAEFGIIEE